MSDILVHTQENTQNNLSPLARDGDWFCLNCNNLNFSFRKKCNRCKTQTRQQNDNNLMYLYQCYGQYYNTPQKQITFDQLNKEQLIEQITDEITPLVTQFAFNNISSNRPSILMLPSVSPIVNRYKKQKKTQKTINSQESSSQNEQFQSQKQFLHQYCWKNILIDEEIQNQMMLLDQNDIWDQQIQKILLNIIT